MGVRGDAKGREDVARVGEALAELAATGAAVLSGGPVAEMLRQRGEARREIVVGTHPQIKLESWADGFYYTTWCEDSKLDARAPRAWRVLIEDRGVEWDGELRYRMVCTGTLEDIRWFAKRWLGIDTVEPARGPRSLDRVWVTEAQAAAALEAGAQRVATADVNLAVAIAVAFFTAIHRADRAAEAFRLCFKRAGGEVACGACGRLYLAHPEDPEEPWLTVLCGGVLVKL